MLGVVNWDLSWTVACGIIIGVGFLSIFSLLGRMLQDNWKVTVLGILSFIISPATIIGAFLGFFGWIWLIPGFIASCIFYVLATNILVKEEEGEDAENY